MNPQQPLPTITRKQAKRLIFRALGPLSKLATDPLAPIASQREALHQELKRQTDLLAYLDAGDRAAEAHDRDVRRRINEIKNALNHWPCAVLILTNDQNDVPYHKVIGHGEDWRQALRRAGVHTEPDENDPSVGQLDIDDDK